MAVCAQCGSPLEGALCPKCGAAENPSGPRLPPVAPNDSSVVIPPLPAQTPEKKHLVLWALGGGLLLIILAGIIGLFIAYKAGIGSGPPGEAIARLLSRNNAEIEVISVDEDRGVIRIRDKKSGKVLTIDLENAEEGKIVLMEGANQKLEIRTQVPDPAAGTQPADGS